MSSFQPARTVQLWTGVDSCRPRTIGKGAGAHDKGGDAAARVVANALAAMPQIAASIWVHAPRLKAFRNDLSREYARGVVIPTLDEVLGGALG